MPQDTQFNGVRVLSSCADHHVQAGANVSQTADDFGRGQRRAPRTDLRRQRGQPLGGVAVRSQAISTVDAALRSVNSLRSTLGAFQNRLEFTINTLAIQEENSAASESAIRDADIAQETIRSRGTRSW